MRIIFTLALGLYLFWGFRLFTTGHSSIRPIRWYQWMPKYDPNSENFRGGGIQVMLFATMGLVVLAVVTFG